MIESKYIVTQEEYAEAQKIYCKPQAKRLPGTIALQISTYLLAALIGMSIVAVPRPLGVALAISLVLFLAISSWRRKSARNYLYQNTGDRLHPVDLIIDDDGYRSRRPDYSECSMAWRCFTGWLEGETVYVLGRGLQFCIVPKKALTNVQQTELRSLLRKNIEISKQPPVNVP